MYFKDPKNNKKSVTLTFCWISFILLAGFSIAKALGHVDNIGAFLEMFVTCMLLYLGRRIDLPSLTTKVKGKSKSGKDKVVID